MALDEEDQASLFASYDDAVNRHDDDDDDDDTEVASINDDDDDEFPAAEEVSSNKIRFVRCDSVGASALDLLHIGDSKKAEGGHSRGYNRRRTMKLSKFRRMSLCVAAAPEFKPNLKRCYRLSQSPVKTPGASTSLKGTPINIIVDTTAFSHVLSFLTQGELLGSASLVCTRFADVAAEALCLLMQVSVGCDPSSNSAANDDSSSEGGESDLVDTQADSKEWSSVAKSMKRSWPYLMDRFPWAQFLSDGSFKRVYKVWNKNCGAYEALSVM